MITNIYINNFKRLIDFRITAKGFQLWTGAAGSGKTSVLEALQAIQQLIGGEECWRVFPSSSLSYWAKEREQTFEISLMVCDDVYKYTVVVMHEEHESGSYIKREELLLNGTSIFLFDGQNVHCHADIVFPAVNSRSVLQSIAMYDDVCPLNIFIMALDKVLVLLPITVSTASTTAIVSHKLSNNAGNFASWYSHIMQAHPDIAHAANARLAAALPGFEQLRLVESGEYRKLTATIARKDKKYDFDFDRLSDGQRQLIVLYVILETLRFGLYRTVLLDTPDNSISFTELNRWVEEVTAICTNDKQAILITECN